MQEVKPQGYREASPSVEIFASASKKKKKKKQLSFLSFRTETAPTRLSQAIGKQTRAEIPR